MSITTGPILLHQGTEEVVQVRFHGKTFYLHNNRICGEHCFHPKVVLEPHSWQTLIEELDIASSIELKALSVFMLPDWLAVVWYFINSTAVSGRHTIQTGIPPWGWNEGTITSKLHLMTVLHLMTDWSLDKQHLVVADNDSALPWLSWTFSVYSTMKSSLLEWETLVSAATATIPQLSCTPYTIYSLLYNIFMTLSQGYDLNDSLCIMYIANVLRTIHLANRPFKHSAKGFMVWRYAKL